MYYYRKMIKKADRSEFAQLYLETNYFVRHADRPIVFHIGETNLDELLKHYNSMTWAFITAYNPFSKQLPYSENETRQGELIDLITSKNLQFLEGFGESMSPDWENETSLFILDIDLEDAISIGRHFEQNAIVFGELGGVPRLIWC